MMSGRSRRFDLYEVLFLVAFTAFAALKIGASSRAVPTVSAKQMQATEGETLADELAAKYGASRNSEHQEEWIIRDFFQDRHDGIFVDIGANDYKKFSNTYYLEAVLGWSGIAVEPQRQYEADYRRYRPRTRFRPFFVSNESNTEAKLYVQANKPLVTSANRSFNTRFGSRVTEVSAPTITLDDLLDAEHVRVIDFLTMDIELWEPKALAGFDIERFKPQFVCIEAQPEVRQQILDYFAGHGYSVVAKYLRLDVANLYFTPRSAE